MKTQSGGAGNRQYHHGDLRRALIDAALELIASEHTARIGLREVARRAGVTHAAPYRHFASREALLAAVAEEGFQDLRVTMADGLEQAGADPMARLQASGVGYVRFAVEHPAHFRVMFGAELAGRQQAYPDLIEASRAAYALLVEVVEACVQAGVAQQGATQELALTAWSLVHGLAMLLVDGQLRDIAADSQVAEDLARVVTSTLQRGMRV